jgi:hypothetical protein
VRSAGSDSRKQAPFFVMVKMVSSLLRILLDLGEDGKGRASPNVHSAGAGGGPAPPVRGGDLHLGAGEPRRRAEVSPTGARARSSRTQGVVLACVPPWPCSGGRRWEQPRAASLLGPPSRRLSPTAPPDSP